MVVSQKTYLELDDAVPSWIEAVVANFFRYPIHVRCTLVGSVRISRPYKQQLNGKTLEFGVPRLGCMLRSQTVACRFASHITLTDLGLAPLVLDLPG